MASFLRLKAFWNSSGDQQTAIGVDTSGEFRLGARIEGCNLPTGSLVLVWDSSHAQLIDGMAQVALPKGTYLRNVGWLLRPLVSSGTIEFRIEARAGSFFQVALVPVEVRSNS